MLEDARDESAEDVRVVLEPKSRAVEADVLMASLFKQCELEVRFPVNINVLDHGVPKVMGLKEILNCYLDHFIGKTFMQAIIFIQLNQLYLGIFFNYK